MDTAAQVLLVNLVSERDEWASEAASLCADPEHKHILGSEPGISRTGRPACGLGGGEGAFALEVC